jgi:RNA polymerase sigma-70 factor (ECF subfamily)
LARPRRQALEENAAPWLAGANGNPREVYGENSPLPIYFFDTLKHSVDNSHHARMPWRWWSAVETKSFDDLMAGLRNGDQSAATSFFRLYIHRVVGLARQKLGGALRQKVDAEDVAQSVLQTVLRRLAAHQFEVPDWEKLWALLAVVTMRKCGRQAEYFHAECRDLSREQNADPPADGSTLSNWKVVDPQPTPEEAAALADTVNTILRGLKDYQQAIFRLALDGVDTDESSNEVRLSRRTVQRTLEGIRRRLEALEGSQDAEPCREGNE